MFRHHGQQTGESSRGVLPPLYVFFHVGKSGGTTIWKHLIAHFSTDELLLVYRKKFPYLTTVADVANYIRSLSRAQKNTLRVIFGHQVYYGIHELFPNREVRYITFLRAPEERVISHYHWDRMRYDAISEVEKFNVWRHMHDHFFAAWFRVDPAGYSVQTAMALPAHSHKGNHQLRFLHRRFFDKPVPGPVVSPAGLERVKAILDSFYFVGITEQARDFLTVYQLLGITKFLPNKNVSPVYLTDMQRRQLRAWLPSFHTYDQALYAYGLSLNKAFYRRHIPQTLGLILVWLRRSLCLLQLRVMEVRRENTLSLMQAYSVLVHRIALRARWLLRLAIHAPFYASYWFKGRSPRYANMVAAIKARVGSLK